MHAYQGSLTPRKYTRERLRSLIVECPSFQHPRKSSGGITLTGKHSFPLVINDAFGKANTSNIYGQGDNLILEHIFEDILEQEASRQYRSGRNLNLQKILSINEGWGRDNMAIKRKACGYRNREHFKTAIYFFCGGLNLYPASS